MSVSVAQVSSEVKDSVCLPLDFLLPRLYASVNDTGMVDDETVDISNILYEELDRDGEIETERNQYADVPLITTILNNVVRYCLFYCNQCID